MVEVNDLRDLGEPREVGFEVRMVEAGAAVQEDDGRHLAHHGAVGPQLRAFHVEEQSDVANIYTHARITNANGWTSQTRSGLALDRQVEEAVARDRFEDHVAFRLGGGGNVAGAARVVERQFEHLAMRHLLEPHFRARPVERTLDAAQVEANRFLAGFHRSMILTTLRVGVNRPRQIAKLARCSLKVPNSTTPSITLRITRASARFCAP